MAQYEDIDIDQGADVAVEIHLTNKDQTAKALNGYSVAAQIRRSISTSDSDAISFNATIPAPASDGIVVLSLTNVQTMALVSPRYYYDVEISFEDSAGDVFIERVLEGHVLVSPNVTRL